MQMNPSRMLGSGTKADVGLRGLGSGEIKGGVPGWVPEPGLLQVNRSSPGGRGMEGGTALQRHGDVANELRLLEQFWDLGLEKMLVA